MTMLNSEHLDERRNLYFMLRDSNDVVGAVNAGRHQIGLSFAQPDDRIYVSISAYAQISTEPALIEKFWNPWAENWFGGKRDPSIRILVAEAISAEYGNITDNKVTQLFKLLKGSLTGHASEVNTAHKKLDL